MKIKLVLLQFAGTLFLVKGFHNLHLLLFDKQSLEVFRTRSSFSFYSRLGDPSLLYVISILGLIGLLIGLCCSILLYSKMKYPKYVLVISTILMFVSNKYFPDLTELINFRSGLLVSFSVKSIILISSVLCNLTGVIILITQAYLKKLNYYLKMHS